MAEHGVPREAINAHNDFWTQLSDGGDTFTVDRQLRDGELIEAGSRTLRVVFRPGHSSTDTYRRCRASRGVVGDHLLAEVSSNTEMC